MTQQQMNRVAHRFEPHMAELVRLVLSDEDIVLEQPPVRPEPKDNMSAWLMGRKVA